LFLTVSRGDPTSRGLRSFTRDARRWGAPYGQDMFSDAIAGRVPAKLQVFLAAWALSPEERRALASRRAPDTVRVWLWAPGFLLPDRADAVAMEEVTGFRHRLVEEPDATATPTAAGERLGLKRPWGLPAAIRPLFAAEAAPEEVLATYRDGAAAAAMRKSERGTDVFVGTPQLTPELLRTLARIAKVHLFTKVDSSVWAADGILSIHALADGPLAVHTGREGPVADAFTGAALGRGPRIVLEIRAGETRILRY
jgi:hypothetical protein